MPDPEKQNQEPTPETEGETEGEGETSVEELSPEIRQMADGWFDRAEQAAVRDNFDYAIRCYLEGLRLNPLDIDRGHQGLKETALKRQGQGKGAGLGALLGQTKAAFSQMLGRNKDAMLNLEAALAKAPQNVMLLSQLMQTARRQEYTDLAIWFGEWAAEESMRSAKKPQKQIFTTLADLYEGRERFADAITALNQAIKIDPADREIDRRIRNLSAAASIQQGKLESVSDFRDMIRDRRTAAASATQQVVRTADQLESQYAELKAALDADPENPVKMQALAECAWRKGDTDEATGLLKQALATSGEYRYKARMDDIRMADYRARLREVGEALEAEPDRADLQVRQKEILEQRNKAELAIYEERHKQYPTDLAIRFELGLRQYRAGRHDPAIVSLQQATRDPKRRIEAFNMLGKCFYAKKLYEEAQGQFEQGIHQYELASDPLGKELRYNLGTTLEQQGKNKEAIEWYSDIVQQDYQYRDTAKRLEALRRKTSETSEQA